jgi:NAD(P)-dependent dehydrogenase (short-subunit alcohol dehydrogenase family)
MDLGLTGRRALITGGSGALGSRIAARLLEEGASVALAARDRGRLDKALDELSPADGAHAVGIVADTADLASVESLVDQTTTALGGIDILVNAAARIGTTAPDLAATTDDLLREELEVKVLGYLRTARAVAPLLVEQGWGRIINISGLAARHAKSTVSSVRNVGVAALTKTLADELGPSGVNVTVVHPGVTATPDVLEFLQQVAEAQSRPFDEVAQELSKSSIGRLVTPDEVADVVAFLASPRSVSINGDAVAVGGGVIGSIYY